MGTMRSWVEPGATGGFPIQNLPLGRVLIDGAMSFATRIEDFVLPFLRLPEGLAKLAADELAQAVREGGDAVLAFRNVREALTEALREGASEELRSALVPHGDLAPQLAMDTRGFADFYAGIHHASNVGRMFRPDQPPLLPNYRHLPIAYNGRASSLIPSGVPVKRPWGQVKSGEVVEFVPTRELDFELEVGWYVGKPNVLGEPIPVEGAESHLLGLALVNDWSARDVQRWEYQPLGPFLAKSFATSVSPWIVSLDALKDARVSGIPQEPAPLPHLAQPEDAHFDIALGVDVNGFAVSESNMKNLYWSVAQQVAHFTSNGANLLVGDLCATGTISGEDPGTFGSMLELSWRGTQPVPLGEEARTFLRDGDEVAFRARAGQIGFGDLRNRVLPADVG